MKNRILPYGYCCENGKVILQPQESKKLAQIYKEYTDGGSLSGIAKQLNNDGVEYTAGVAAWNKGRLKRLLEDKRYLGTENYPQIIDKEIFETVQNLKSERNNQKETDRKKGVFRLSVPIKCPDCGSAMHRRHDGRCKCQQRWSCKNNDCNTIIDIADNDLLKEICELLETVKPENIARLNKKPFLPSDEVNRLNNEINRMLDSREIDRETLRDKMFNCVSEKYSSLDNDLYTTQKLQLEFERPVTDDWMQKFNRTVSEIGIYKNKAIGIVLLNGQLIGKEQKNGTGDCNKSTESGSCNRAYNIGKGKCEKQLPTAACSRLLSGIYQARRTVKQL